MPRLNKLEEIDFPVTAHPVYVITGKSDAEKRILVHDKKALINDNNQRVLGIGYWVLGIGYWVLLVNPIGWSATLRRSTWLTNAAKPCFRKPPAQSGQ